MPGRKFVSGEGYRFGFNGKEGNPEIADGNLDFGARNYDGRIGRWWSVDPYKSIYSNISPYTFALNSPIKFLDHNGGYVVDEDGNIVFVPEGKPYFHTQWEDDTQSKLESMSILGKPGIAKQWGYKAQKGYIIANNGKKVEVLLVNDKTVYYASQKYTTVMNDETGAKEVLAEGSPSIEGVKEGYVASPNCAGDGMLEGKFVLFTDIRKGAPRLLDSDGYDENIEAPQEGDLGLYYDKKRNLVHVEQYETKDKVSSKGGVTQKVSGATPGKTWDKEGTFIYEIVRRVTLNKEVKLPESAGDSKSVPGVRILSEEEAKEYKVRKQARKQKDVTK